MCDPISALGLVAGVVGGRKKAAPPPKVPEPTPVAAEALEQTGADVLLGGTAAPDEDRRKRARRASTQSQAITGVSGLSTAAGGAGIQIL